MTEPQFRISKLLPDHDLEHFDCGVDELNTWFKRFALSDQRARVSATYVLHASEKVSGFYTLTPHAIDPDRASGRLRTGLPSRRPIPVLLLARLALDHSVQGKGLAAELLKDALIRCVNAARRIGGRAVVVHAKNTNAARFYARHGFEPMPENPQHLYVLTKDLIASLREAIE